MDQQEHQERSNRQPPRSQRNNQRRNNQRRNTFVQRRSMVHYQEQNINGNVTVTNDYYFDTNEDPLPSNSGAPNYSISPPSQPLPLTVHGPSPTPNSREEFPSNLQVSYGGAPPVSYFPPPQAIHIAIPITIAPTSQISQVPLSSPPTLNGITPRNPNNAASRIMNAFPQGTMNATSPRMMNAGSPEVLSGSDLDLQFVPISMPGAGFVGQPGNAYLITPHGNIVTLPPVNLPPPIYFPMPSASHMGAHGYSYPTYQRVLPRPYLIPNGVRITPVEDVPPVPMDEVDSLVITEVVSSSDE